MWKPGQLVQVKERIPMNGVFVEFSTTCRVVRNSGHHRCLNCPMQQKYCNISVCETMLPLTCTLKKAQQDSEQSES